MRIDFHVHTSRSPDGLHSLRETVKHAKRIGLDGIAITDHARLLSRREARSLTREFGILVIPGIEGGHMALDRHWIALAIDIIPATVGIAGVLAHIAGEGGLSIAPHPHSCTGYNNYARLGFDAVEAFNGTDRLSNSMIRNTAGLPETGGSDAHATYMLGYTWTEMERCATVEEAVEMVRRGRCRPAGTLIPAHKKMQFYGRAFVRYTTGRPQLMWKSMQSSFAAPPNAAATGEECNAALLDE
ncbi:MAG: PHP domain-containing protein [Methanomicrobiaceae archaeon]|nr:PHP domain-containing protein [Methanomicrobiaceae archaeon]